MARKHREEDRYIAGSYAKGKGDDWRGCSIGCSVRSLQLLGRLPSDFHNNYHAGLAVALGWPEWLVRLQDTLFEGLLPSERPAWTETLAQAVPIGVDLEPVRW